MSEIKNISGASDLVPRTTKFANYSAASRLRQSLIPKAVRSARASAAAHAKWKNISLEDRHAHAIKMVDAKHGKKNI